MRRLSPNRKRAHPEFGKGNTPLPRWTVNHLRECTGCIRPMEFISCLIFIDRDRTKGIKNIKRRKLWPTFHKRIVLRDMQTSTTYFLASGSMISYAKRLQWLSPAAIAFAIRMFPVFVAEHSGKFGLLRSKPMSLLAIAAYSVDILTKIVGSSNCNTGWPRKSIFVYQAIEWTKPVSTSVRIGIFQSRLVYAGDKTIRNTVW